MPSESIAGYRLLSLPSPDIRPLSILFSREKSSAETTNTNIKKLFANTSADPPALLNRVPLFSQGNRSLVAELSVDGHVNLLQHLLGWLKASASIQLQKNRSVRLHMEAATKLMVDEFDLDGFIAASKANTSSPAFKEMLDEQQLFVVTSVIQCKKYAFEYMDSRATDAELKLEVPLEGEVGAKVHEGKTAKDDMIFEGEGDTNMTMAVKAYRILYVKDNGSYRLRVEDEIKNMKHDEDLAAEPLDAEMITVNPPEQK
jgi:hypothetical protein